MLVKFKSQLTSVIESALKNQFQGTDLPPVDLEVPNDKSHGDFSTNIALKSAKVLKQAPQKIAQDFCEILRKEISSSQIKTQIEQIDVKGPGFINFILSKQAVYEVLQEVFAERENFGRSDFGQKEKIQIEFVSANPTGPLSVAHARQAVVGDALASILKFIGFQADREYYVNDEGNQINLLGESIKARACGIFGEERAIPEGGYQGEYIKDIARELINAKNISDRAGLEQVSGAEYSRFGVDYLMNVIRAELDEFGVHFDCWAHQSEIATEKSIEDVLEFLKDKKHLYENEGALWFKTTDLGDDKDRVLKKSDGSYTYFTPDIAYHRDKFKRGYSRVINIWGPDHHGYIPRLTAAVEALGRKREDLNVLIVQLATIYRDGQPLSMSTRKGQYISLREVMDEVGVDAARYFFLMRHINVHLDFDLELAKKQSAENPVYYIQYAHARIHSILAKARDVGLEGAYRDFSRLTANEEIDLIKKIGGFPDMLLLCYHQMDPYPLVNYLQEAATCFHKFYDSHKVVDPQNPELSSQRLALIDATKTALANGLKLLGVSQPEQM